MPRVHVHVTGIVQGVGYRPFVWNLATARGLIGWVRNASDGVHIEAKGDQAAIDSFVLALSMQAPAAARVDTVHVDRMSDDRLAPLSDEVGRSVKAHGAEKGSDFRIVHSDSDAARTTLISPDISACDACVSELFDPENRRYHYPFINCTNCGPRFTIIDDLPYDRANTSMARFTMCPECQAEYDDPADRRFHAQPDACFECGPHLSWRTTENPGVVEWGRTLEQSDAIISKAAQMLLFGGIVAIKGLGGFHLACDATNERAVARLRERKHRPTKPLAVMFERLDEARRVCEIDAAERGLLSGSVRPIVLLRRRDPQALAGRLPARLTIAPSVAGELPELGVMLPYTPLHHLLLRLVKRPLVMTSGNLSEEPVICDDQIAVARLMDVADAFLGNDRPIRTRYDDSVARVVGGTVMHVRRARGVAPTPVRMALPSGMAAGAAASAGTPSVGTSPAAMAGPATSTITPAASRAALPEVLACGPEQKATFCITRGDEAFVSQHVGDLENAETLDAWKADLHQYERLFGLSWNVLACDMHPEYLSSKWAREQAEKHGIPLTEVQHHHAHIASVLAENGVEQQVVGLALDGTGYGTDGTIWGGEVLLCDQASFVRAAHLSRFDLPGGAAAIHKPLRATLGLLASCGLSDEPVAAEVVRRLGIEGPVTRQMLERSLNCPRTSSAGRLFDAVAALLGLVDEAGYDGEPACLLEAAAARACDDELPEVASDIADAYGATAEQSGQATGVAGAGVGAPDPAARYRMELHAETAEDPMNAAGDGSFTVDARPLVRAVLDDRAAGVPLATIARRFHDGFCEGVSRAAIAVARANGIGRVALSGGVFMNRLVLSGVRLRLEEAGLTVLLPREMPVNDGCIAYGQAAVARARMAALAAGTSL